MIDIKKIVIPVIGVGIVITGILLRGNSKAMPDAAKAAFKTAIEPDVTFGGIPLLKLNELSKEIYHGIKCTIDKWGFLVFHYKSKRGHQTFYSQMKIDDANKLVNMFNGHYQGQWWSSADEFVKRANELFSFKK